MLVRVDALADVTRWRGAPVADIVAACAAELVGIARQRRNLLAAFLHRATADAAWRAEALRFRATVSSRVARLLLTRRDAIRHPDPELALDLGMQFAFAFMLQLVLTGEVRAAGRALSDAELRRELERSFLSYVGFAPADAPRGATP